MLSAISVFYQKICLGKNVGVGLGRNVDLGQKVGLVRKGAIVYSLEGMLTLRTESRSESRFRTESTECSFMLMSESRLLIENTIPNIIYSTCKCLSNIFAM